MRTLLLAIAPLLVAGSHAWADRSERFVTGGWRIVVRHAAPASGESERAIVTGALPAAGAVGARSQSGLASYYWQGTKTASGEPFDKRQLTAAHRSLPFGTRVRVTHLASGRSVLVRINDRGPFKPGRIIDLSERAAEDLGMTRQGLARVSVEVVER